MVPLLWQPHLIKPSGLRHILFTLRLGLLSSTRIFGVLLEASLVHGYQKPLLCSYLFLILALLIQVSMELN